MYSKPNQFISIRRFWKNIFILIAVLSFIAIPAIYESKESRCAYVILLMATFWMTEAIPLPITALIPVFGFPLLGVLGTKETCIVYLKEVNMMFLGGLTVACAVEHSKLHKRIAVSIIYWVGQSPRMLLAGVMMTTMFLSMWICNAATTTMMVPIVEAIAQQIYEPEKEREEVPKTSHLSCDMRDEMREVVRNSSNGRTGQNQIECGGCQVTPYRNGHAKQNGELSSIAGPSSRLGKRDKTMRDMLYLGTAYSANLGGTGSLTGSMPNLVAKGVLQKQIGDTLGLNFGTWMAFNVPGMIICVFLGWIWLQIFFLGCCGSKKAMNEEQEGRIKVLIKRKYKELGGLSFHESVVLVLFITLVLLWFFRAPEFIPGWESLFQDAYGNKMLNVDDATAAMLIVFLLFVIPCRIKETYGEETTGPVPGCLTWDVVKRKIPWGVILLLGGGFAMAKAAKVSGLSKLIGAEMVKFQALPPWAIVLVICILTAMITEVAPNGATASILLPVLLQLATSINVNPLYLILPVTVSCNYAFMLPVAGPPNAIAFAAAGMRTRDMIKAGIVMNIMCCLVVNVMINTLGEAMFNFSVVPEVAANVGNMTTKAMASGMMGMH